MSVVPIRQPVGAENIPATLRRIADHLETGEHGLVTTCLVVTGHTTDRPAEDGQIMQAGTFDLFGLGPRTDIFTVRGLLLTAATRL